MNLKDIKSPADIKHMPNEELQNLACEIRDFLVRSVSETGGHLASNLGVVELTLALHSVFDFSKDRIIWDVGHQAYVHKLLTGRMDKFTTLRKFGGISGFPKRNESIYDVFDTGHSSTSASAALGMARGRDLSEGEHDIVAVFGDGALTGGMIFEALNDAGHSDSKVIFVLNDNDMSICENVGALSKYLQKLRLKPKYFKSKNAIEKLLRKLPVGSDKAIQTAMKVKELVKNRLIQPTMFDNLGLNYIGPVDGHDIESLRLIFERAKKSKTSSFIHVKTVKGRGYSPAEKNPSYYHGISAGGTAKSNVLDYSTVFGKKLVKLAEDNDKIVAVTAAMPLGTGLTEFSQKFKNRFLDVGIAEQHAVCMAAGLATQGYIPVVPIYSTFLQRAYDQILHDVCLQNLHVVLCADRAGIVGQDGETHQGMYDIAYLMHMPNMTILSPSTFSELEEMLDYAVNVHTGPVVIRYPRGGMQSKSTFPFAFSKCNTNSVKSDILIITTGRISSTAEEVAEKYNAQLLYMPTVKPFCADEVINHAKGKKLVVTVEDGTKNGGIGSMTAQALAESDVNTKLLICAFPDTPITHGTVSQLDAFYKMDAPSIIERIEEKLNV